jgi:dethiobiotin synthetase
VASGSEMTAEGLRNTDALALQRNSTPELAYSAVNPYTFAEPTSPHIISADEGRPIDFAVLSAGLRTLESQADWVLVEGAGGWFTPLSDTRRLLTGCRPSSFRSFWWSASSWAASTTPC